MRLEGQLGSASAKIAEMGARLDAAERERHVSATLEATAAREVTYSELHSPCACVSAALTAAVAAGGTARAARRNDVGGVGGGSALSRGEFAEEFAEQIGGRLFTRPDALARSDRHGRNGISSHRRRGCGISANCLGE